MGPPPAGERQRPRQRPFRLRRTNAAVLSDNGVEPPEAGRPEIHTDDGRPPAGRTGDLRSQPGCLPGLTRAIIGNTAAGSVRGKKPLEYGSRSGKAAYEHLGLGLHSQ